MSESIRFCTLIILKRCENYLTFLPTNVFFSFLGEKNENSKCAKKNIRNLARRRKKTNSEFA